MEDDDDDQKQITSTFTSVFWNRGHYDGKQKGSPLGEVVESLIPPDPSDRGDTRCGLFLDGGQTSQLPVDLPDVFRCGRPRLCAYPGGREERCSDQAR